MKIKELVFLVMVFGVSMNSDADLIVVKDTGNTVSSDNYLKGVHTISDEKIMNDIDSKKNKLMNRFISMNDIGYPDHSIFTPGKVKPHRIKDGYFDTVPIFVIGSDSKSLRWARINKNYLKKIDAIGIITNVDSVKITEHVEKEIGMNLIVSDLDGLEKIIGTTHYPFLIQNGLIFQ